MEKKLFAGNWKMFQNVESAQIFVRRLRSLLQEGKLPLAKAEFVILPQAPLLSVFAETARASASSGFAWGPQNLYWEADGAFTGELSPRLAQEFGSTFALAGHSERRQFFGESDASAAKRALAALHFGMTPIFCVGENLAERDGGRLAAVLERQCQALLELAPTMPKRFVVAYEPVWAIGTGRTASASQAEEAHLVIRRIFSAAWGEERARTLEILYGGSVKPQNARELLSCPNVDGVLVGGASLDADNFFNIAVQAFQC